MTPHEPCSISPRVIAGALRRLGALAVDTSHAITARKLWMVALLTLAYAGVLTIGALPMLLERQVWTPVLNAILSAQLSGFAVLFAVAVVERATDTGRARYWPYVAAVAVGVAVASLSLWFISQRLIGIGTGYVAAGAMEPFSNFVLRHWVHAGLVCGLGTAVYVIRKRATERMASLRSLQIQAADSERLLVKTRLAALRARVEPRFLIDTLARVESLYSYDPLSGDRLLGQLIAYLRAALPHLHEITSTLGRELRLADAYMAVHAGAGSSRLRATLGGTATEHTSVPPMLLLPLIDHVLTMRPNPDSAVPDLALEATLQSGQLRISLHDRGDRFAPEKVATESISLLRERLRALFADSATLACRRTATGSAAVIDILELKD